MRLQLLSAAFCLAFSSGALASTFTTNDTRSNAMGGTGVASAEPASAGNLNPGLLANYGEDEKLGIVLPAVGGFIEDPRGFVNSIIDFVDEDLEAYTNLSSLDITGSANAVITASGNVATAADAYQADPTNDQKYQDLVDANDVLTTSINTLNGDVNDVDTVVETTKTSFENFSSKPMQAALLFNLGLAVPRSDLGWAITGNNNSYIGAELGLASADLIPVDQTLDDLDEYLVAVSDVSAKLSAVLVAADALKNAAPADVPARQQDLDDATTELETAQANLDTITTTNQVFVNGDYSEPVGGDLTASDFDSTINVLGVNILEVGAAAAKPMEYSGEEFTTGIRLKFQYLTIFDDQIGFSDFEDDASGTLQETISSNTKEYFTGNIDIGVAKNFEYKGKIVAGAVIRDFIPQTFKSANGGLIRFTPQLRIGAAHSTRWSTLAIDLDITENQPIAFGNASRYLSLGAEFDAWKTIKLRTGYRNNLSVSGSSTVSLGMGLTPFGVGLDLTGWFTPSSDPLEMAKNAGILGQFSLRF